MTTIIYVSNDNSNWLLSTKTNKDNEDIAEMFLY